MYDEDHGVLPKMINYLFLKMFGHKGKNIIRKDDKWKKISALRLNKPLIFSLVFFEQGSANSSANENTLDSSVLNI